MYEGLRLTELHEEWAWNNYHAQSDERCGEFDKAEQRQAKVEALEDEIRARVAAQEIEPVGNRHGIYQLLFGVPDALREYRTLYERTERALNYDQPHHWTNHAQHAVPVEGCRLCHRGSMPIWDCGHPEHSRDRRQGGCPNPECWRFQPRLVHEEHVPCE